jgi:signal transducing adaptor molecule
MLIAMWTEDFESDPNLGMIEECYGNLKAKGTAFTPLTSFYAHFAWTDYKFEPVDEPPPRDDDEARRREAEELQRVLELPRIIKADAGTGMSTPLRRQGAFRRGED